jgi:hypothetical protein
MITLPQITLIGVDCVSVERLLHAAAICERGIAFGAVRILSSIPHQDPRVVTISPIASREQYSSFVVKQLNRYVETPFALVFQYDGFVLNPASWRDEFRAYDYIGAPLSNWPDEGRPVGNGGFSLRSKRLLMLLENDPAVAVPEGLPEDWYLCVTIRPYLEAQGIRFAPFELAQQFSFEGDEHHEVTWSGQFGFHGLTWTDISPWLRENLDSGVVNELDQATRAAKARLGT